MHENKRFVKTLKTVKIVQTWIYFILSNLKDKNLTRLYWSDFYCFLKFNTETVRFSNLIKKRLIPSKHINVESMLIINVHRRCFTLIFGWKWKLSRRTFIDVVSTLTKQRWNNVDRITSIQRRWTNVVSTLKFGWKWKLSQCMFIDVVSILTKQRWSNVDRVTLIQCWWPNVCFNVGIRLKREVESTHVHRCWENSIETTLSIFVVLRFTRKWLNNKTKLSFQV